MQNGITLETRTKAPGRPSALYDYVALALLVASGAYCYIFLATTHILKFEAAEMLLLGYTLWGTIHHERQGTLTWIILIEYIALISFVSAVLAILFVVL